MKTRTWKEVSELVQELKKKGKEIVFTNGCFDILHAGHIQYLMDAKELGDVLIIGLNSDASVKKLKGDSRPINNEHDRAFVLSALSMVDYVVIFDQDTPHDLINIIMPDFLVKGGDWKVKDIVGSDIVQASGGVVRSLPFKEGYSTTEMIEKIKKLIMEENKLEDVAVVTEVNVDHILVQMMKSGSCESCGMSGLCHGKDRIVTHKIFTDNKYKVGDLLKVEVAPGLKIATSMLVFLVPILAMILFYSIASYGFHLSEPLSILSAFAGLIFSGIIIYRIDRRFGKKINFEIKARVEK